MNWCPEEKQISNSIYNVFVSRSAHFFKSCLASPILLSSMEFTCGPLAQRLKRARRNMQNVFVTAAPTISQNILLNYFC